MSAAAVASSRPSTPRPVSVPRNDLRDAPTTIGQPSARSSVEPRQQRQVVRGRLGEAEPGIDEDAPQRHAGGHGRVDALRQLGDHLAHHVVVARVRVHVGRRAAQVAEDERTRRGARRRAAARDRARRPTTSFTISAPASSAAAATAALYVSMRDGDRAGERAHHRQHARRLLFGRHRRRARPRRLAAHVDDVGAVGDEPPPWAMAAAASSEAPPSENESGVTLTTPMTIRSAPVERRPPKCQRRSRPGPCAILP